MKQYHIYKIICLMDEWNGKFYIGKHYGKLDDNYTGSGKLIREYFKEFGKERNITYEKIILEIGDENSICDLERDYIREGLKSELCLNMICNSPHNKQFSEEARRKIGEAQKGKKLSYETKEKISNSLKNNNIVVWNKGKTGCYSEDTKRKISESLKGYKHSEESRKKMSEAAKRRWNKKS